MMKRDETGERKQAHWRALVRLFCSSLNECLEWTATGSLDVPPRYRSYLSSSSEYCGLLQYSVPNKFDAGKTTTGCGERATYSRKYRTSSRAFSAPFQLSTLQLSAGHWGDDLASILQYLYKKNLLPVLGLVLRRS